MTERELLRRAAELAADHLDTLETRPVYPQVSVDELTARIDVPLPRRADRPGRGRRGARGRARARRRREPERALLRLRRRLVAAVGARRRRAGLGLGPEPRAVGARPVGARRREHGRRLGQGPPGDPGDRVVRLRHGLPDRPLHVPCRGATARARRRRLGRRRAGPCRLTAPHGARRLEAPLDDRPRAALPRRSAGRRSTRSTLCRTAGSIPRPPRRARRRRGADDRLRPGGRGEHWRVRRPRRDRRRGRGHGRLAPRRRCVRAVGRGEPVAPPSRRRVGAGRLVGDRRPQVAQCPVRLRHRLLRAPRRAP